MGSAEDGTPDVAPALSGSRSDLGVGEQDVDAAVVRQVEFYLSWRNLQADYYLKERMTPDHWVPLQLIVDFPKMKAFQISSVENLARILKENSTELEVNLSTFQVRPLFLVQDTKRSVLILREIPSGTSEQEIRDLFDGVEDCPPIYSIMPELENQWFVTFDTEKGAHLAFELTKTMHFKDKTVKARVKNNPTAGASYLEPGVLPVVELAQPNTPTYYAPPYYQRGGFAGPLPQDPVSAPVVTGAIPMVQHQRRSSRGVLSPQPNHRSSPSPQARGQGPAGGVPVTAGGSERGTSSPNMRPNQRLSRQANASKGGRPKGKRNRYPEGGENRGSDSAAEKPKQDVSFTQTNFPPLGKEDTPQNEEKEPTEQKEAREAKDTKDTKNTKDTKEVKEPAVNVVKEAADKSSTPSAEKVANDVSAVVSDDDKRASRSSSESGANGSAKTYASILLAAKAAKQQVPVQDSPSPTQAHARLNDVASAQKEKESVTPPRDAPDPVKEEPKPETSGTNNLNTNQSVTAAEASGDSPDERGVADVKPEVTEETRPVSVW
eukprot:CAMPEP_0113957734 /NCGR_PEP_ID=MMETSP0011_2-20120614/2945_1 /TAXON_ID=101924 /ORGANISM="Rhodosorus marinus" /LENGTH=548 /DNA_ID=CAMNT_0000968351 /DNA_START=37 /DNA_END=1680 /DNA_ORIENTATION=- /assembly_acc=CAM_ASM_000156